MSSEDQMLSQARAFVRDRRAAMQRDYAKNIKELAELTGWDEERIRWKLMYLENQGNMLLDKYMILESLLIWNRIED